VLKKYADEVLLIDSVSRTTGSDHPEDRRTRQWFRARGRISAQGGHQAHLSALAYMSDSYFIGTVARVHELPRFSSAAALQRVLQSLKNPSDLDGDTIARYLKDIAENEEEEKELRASASRWQNGDKTLDTAKLSSFISRRNAKKNNDEIGMMVSLDHTIYFHNPRAFRADEWMLSEMESPWAGEGRGLVMQKLWSRDGVLIATCVQEVSTNHITRSPMCVLFANANLLSGCRPTKARREPTSSLPQHEAVTLVRASFISYFFLFLGLDIPDFLYHMYICPLTTFSFV
jgi:hypothetical protein